MFIFDIKINKYLPALVVCSAIFLIKKIRKIDLDDFSNILTTFNINQQELMDCTHVICNLLDNIQIEVFKKVRNKYMKKQYCEVANFNFLNN